jgi:hypothetical protein
MITAPMLELLKTCVPSMQEFEDDEESNSFIITVPKADSMFFREMTSSPILQHISTFKMLGVDFDPSFELIEGEESSKIVLRYDYPVKHDLLDWRSLIECDDFVQESEEDEFLARLMSIVH